MQSKYADKWLPAFQKEFLSQIANKSWKLIPRSEVPSECIILPHKWVGKYKPGYGTPGEPDYVEPRFKGRLTVVGSYQKYGVDFEETYAPVPRLESVRAALSEMAVHDLNMITFDIATAFLNATVDKPIYMTQPEGFVENGKEDHVCLLLKAVYGIKQAPRLWNKTFLNVILQFGLQPTSADSCVYVRFSENQKDIFIAFVDDGVFGSTSKETVKKFAEHLSNTFDVRSLPLTRFIGINMERDTNNQQIFLSQKHVILKALEKFGMSNCQPRSTPADPNARLSSSMTPQTEGGNLDMSTVPFREAVGLLLYLTTTTRPDIAFAVSQVSKFCQDPQPAHWKAVKRIFAYLKGTSDFGLWLGGRRDEDVTGYTDADYAGDTDDRKSTSGSIFFFHGGPIAWSSRKQKCTALSTTEAEYVSLSEAIKDALWISSLAKDLSGGQQETPSTVPIFCDNQSAIKLVKNPEFHQRSKHIDVRYHFVRQQQSEERVDVQFVKSEDQLADIFTKPLPAPRFIDLRERIGVGKFNDE